MLIGLVALYALFVVFYFIPLPDSIISITFRNHMKTSRLFTVISFISVLILIRSLASLKKIGNSKLIVVLSIILSVAMVYLSKFYFVDYYVTWMLLALVIIYSIAFASIFMAHNDRGKRVFLISVILMSLVAGGLVNPIDYGTDVLYENDFAHEVESIVSQNPDANWIAQSVSIDYLTIFGARTVNSVNVYPDLDKWQQFDINNESQDIYNRYSHITVNLINDSDTSFNLVSPDVFNVDLNVNDLSKLNITYIASNYDLEVFNNENVTFNKIYDDGISKIYEVSYSK